MQEQDHINAIRTALEEIKTTQAVAANHAETMTKELERVRRIITGESEPERGLVLRLRNIETVVEEIQREARAVKSWTWTAIGSALIGLGSFIGQKLFQ